MQAPKDFQCNEKIKQITSWLQWLLRINIYGKNAQQNAALPTTKIGNIANKLQIFLLIKNGPTVLEKINSLRNKKASGIPK